MAGCSAEGNAGWRPEMEQADAGAFDTTETDSDSSTARVDSRPADDWRPRPQPADAGVVAADAQQFDPVTERARCSDALHLMEPTPICEPQQRGCSVAWRQQLCDWGCDSETSTCAAVTLLDGSEKASDFSDGKTAVVYAHQDDDLLWMLPWWPYARGFFLSAYAADPVYQAIVEQHPPQYQARWRPIWGMVTSRQLARRYLDDTCARTELINLQTLTAQLEVAVDWKQIRRVVTHNNWGEYGHVQHRLVNQAVRQLAVRHNKDVWALSVLASPDPDNTRHRDVGPFGLPTVRGYFMHTFFSAMRARYRARVFDERVLGQRIDRWTWHEAEFDYPHGTRTFVQLVRGGVDLTRTNAEIAALTASTAEFGGCQR